MRVTFYELQKIFGWKRVLLTIIFCVIYYFLMIDFQVHFVSRGGAQSGHQLAVQMVEDFGLEMDREEFVTFLEATDEAYGRFDELLQSNAELQELGVTSFDSLWNFYVNEPSLSQEGRLEEELNLLLELMARNVFTSFYESKIELGGVWTQEQLGRANQTELQQLRQQEIRNREAQSILSESVFLGYRQMIWMTARMVVLSLVIMISPIYLTERRNRMFSMQYTTKIGRRLFHKKVIASMMAAMIIITIQLGIIFALYSREGTSMFFQADINSFLVVDHVSWLDITFGQYILLTVGLVYLIGLIMAVLIPFLSRISPNYLTVMGIQIPLVLILFNNFFEYLIFIPTSIFFPPFLVPALYTGLILLVVVLTVVQWRREKTVDIKI